MSGLMPYRKCLGCIEERFNQDLILRFWRPALRFPDNLNPSPQNLNKNQCKEARYNYSAGAK